MNCGEQLFKRFKCLLRQSRLSYIKPGTSTCLFAASEVEGLCAPLIETARHKLLIIANDIAVFAR